jgi:hypothetical protein
MSQELESWPRAQWLLKRVLVVIVLLVVTAAVLSVGYRMTYDKWPWSAYPTTLNACGRDFQPEGNQTREQIAATSLSSTAPPEAAGSIRPRCGPTTSLMASMWRPTFQAAAGSWCGCRSARTAIGYTSSKVVRDGRPRDCPNHGHLQRKYDSSRRE